MPAVGAEHAMHKAAGHDHASGNGLFTAKVALGAAAAIIAVPYVPSLFGAPSDVTTQILNLCQAGAPGGSGLTGAANAVLSSVPVVGSTLAAGGWVSAAATGIIGIGGTYLGNYIHRYYDAVGHIPWGKVLTYAALGTSMLIALPSLLSGISMGLTFLAYYAGGAEFASSVAGFMSNTLGMMGSSSAIASGAGLTGLLSHFVTCGAVLLPAGAALVAAPSASEQPESGRYRVNVLPMPPTDKDEKCLLAFQIIDRATGQPLSPDQLEITHTKKLHTLIIDRGLNDYHHLHPSYDPVVKAFTCEFEPSVHGGYVMWNEFVRSGEKAPEQLRSELPSRVIGTPSAAVTISHEYDVGGLHISMEPDMPMRAGKQATIEVRVSSPDGKPVDDLQPVLGAFAHLAGFSADGKHFVHCHPIGAEPQSDHDKAHGVLRFHVQPEFSGKAKFFLQIRRGGHEFVAPFGFQVQPPQRFAERLEASHAAHAAVPAR